MYNFYLIKQHLNTISREKRGKGGKREKGGEGGIECANGVRLIATPWSRK